MNEQLENEVKIKNIQWPKEIKPKESETLSLGIF